MPSTVVDAFIALLEYISSNIEPSQTTTLLLEHMSPTHVEIIYNYFGHNTSTSYNSFLESTSIRMFGRRHHLLTDSYIREISFPSNESPPLLRAFIDATFGSTTEDQSTIRRSTRTRRTNQFHQDFTQERSRYRRRIEPPPPSHPSPSPSEPPSQPDMMDIFDNFVKKIHEPAYKYCDMCKERKRSTHRLHCHQCTKDMSKYGYSTMSYTNDMDPFHAPNEHAENAFSFLCANHPLNEIEQVSEQYFSLLLSIQFS